MAMFGEGKRKKAKKTKIKRDEKNKNKNIITIFLTKIPLLRHPKSHYQPKTLI